MCSLRSLTLNNNFKIISSFGSDEISPHSVYNYKTFILIGSYYPEVRTFGTLNPTPQRSLTRRILSNWYIVALPYLIAGSFDFKQVCAVSSLLSQLLPWQPREYRKQP